MDFVGKDGRFICKKCAVDKVASLPVQWTKWTSNDVSAVEYKLYLIATDKDETLPPCLVVGYLNSHRMWVCPGLGRREFKIEYYANVIPDYLNPPVWAGFQKEVPKVSNPAHKVDKVEHRSPEEWVKWHDHYPSGGSWKDADIEMVLRSMLDMQSRCVETVEAVRETASKCEFTTAEAAVLDMAIDKLKSIKP